VRSRASQLVEADSGTGGDGSSGVGAADSTAPATDGSTASDADTSTCTELATSCTETIAINYGGPLLAESGYSQCLKILCF
jgi:hypothetical protein